MTIFRFANLLLAIISGRRYGSKLIISNLRAALSEQYCLDLYANFRQRNASRVGFEDRVLGLDV